MTTQVLFDPIFKARIVASRSALSLGQGEWQSLGDVRTADRTLRARFGTTNLSSIVTGAEWRGGIVGQFLGVPTIFIAVYVTLSTKVRVYMSTDASTWTEVTKEFNLITPSGFDSTIGPFGNTRMDDDGPVWFAIAQDRDIKVVNYPSDPYAQDVLVFGNQSSSPRAFGPFNGGTAAGITGQYTAIIEEISPPTSTQDIPVKATLVGSNTGMAIGNAGDMDIHNSGANFVFSESGGSTNNHMLLTIGTSSASGDTAVMEDTASAKLLLSGKQIHIGVETATLAEFLAKVKIDVGTYSGSFSSAATLYDPTGNRTGVVTTTLGTNIYLLSFDVEEYSTLAANTYDAIRMTFMGGAPSASRTVKVWFAKAGVSVASANPGGTLWAHSWFNFSTHTESKGVVFKDISYPKRVEGVGSEVPDDYTSYAIPSSADLYFAFTVPLLNPTQAQANKGVEAARVYRKLPDESTYSLLEYIDLVRYSEPMTDHDSNAGTPDIPVPTWSFVSGSASSIVRTVMVGRGAVSPTSYPSEFHVPMPTARAAIGTSDRVYVATNSTSKPNFMFSEQDQCFRFREISDIASDGSVVARSAGALNLQGDSIVGFAQVSGAQVGTLPNTAIGVATVYAFGKESVYLTGGKTGEEIMSMSDMGIPGTVSPFTITVGRNEVFYLDREGQVRKIRGGVSEVISRQRVDSITKNIPSSMKRYAWGAYYNERYYLGYCPSGGTRNTKILVWSDEIGDWESIDTPPLTTEFGLNFADPADNTVKLIAFMQAVGGGGTETLRANTYDLAATTDLGSNITISGTSHEIHQLDWAGFAIKHMYIEADQVTGGSVSYTVDYRDGGSQTSTCSLASTTLSEIRRDDTTPVNTDPARGSSAAVTFSASVTGGKRIYNLLARLEPRTIERERSDAT